MGSPGGSCSLSPLVDLNGVRLGTRQGSGLKFLDDTYHVVVPSGGGHNIERDERSTSSGKGPVRITVT